MSSSSTSLPSSSTRVQYVPPSLKYLFVVQPNLGGESCESDAILAFFPLDTPEEDQLVHSGLAQAFSGFTR